MGREIRRVPPDWEHPKRHLPWGFDYKPMHDESYEEALAKWQEEKRKWDAGERPDYFKSPDDTTFEEYHGEEPDREYYRPAWAEETRTALQIYETVSEGTPVSPIFTTEDETVEWIVSEWGRSPEAARQFVGKGWAPSFVMKVGESGTRISDPNAGAWEPEFFGSKGG